MFFRDSVPKNPTTIDTTLDIDIESWLPVSLALLRTVIAMCGAPEKLNVMTDGRKFFSNNEHPPRGDLRKMMDQQPLPTLAPGLIDPASMTVDEATNKAFAVLDIFNTALTAGDAETLENCFYADQAYWKDQLSLTYHLRTFSTPGIIAAGLLETAKLRGISKGIEVDGTAMFLPVTPVLVSATQASDRYDLQENDLKVEFCIAIY